MANFGQATLRIGTLVVRAIQFISAAIVLGIYSYFLAVLSRHHTQIPPWEKGVEGFSGAAALYTLIAVLTTYVPKATTEKTPVVLTCADRVPVGFLVLSGASMGRHHPDLCFFVCFIAVVILTRHGADKCSGLVKTPLGTGPSDESAPGAGSYHYVCGLNSAAFALAIINMLLFLVSPALQLILMRHHKHDHSAVSTSDMKHTSGRR